MPRARKEATSTYAVRDVHEGKTNLEIALGKYSNVTYEDDGKGWLSIHCHRSGFSDDKKISRKEFFQRSIEAIQAIAEFLEGKESVQVTPAKKWWEFWK